ncbi:MAG: hypothetical protein QG658_165 [Patescibacteria group bacterium]|nr:hypothetical protein [Patescibacteria group bacterium]
MVRVAKKLHRNIGHSRIHQQNLPKKRLAFLLGLGLIIGGTVAALVTFAGTGRVDTLVTIGDEAGGFHNALIAVNPDNGNKIGSLTAPNLPNLSGCSLTQPKPYLYDMVVDTAKGIAIAGLKPCQGGRLNAGQAIARFNLATMRFDRYIDGPTEGVAAIQMVDAENYAVLNTIGSEVRVYSLEGGVRHKVALGGAATRFGLAFGNVVVAYSDGSIDKINPATGARERLGSAGVALPRQAGIDGLRVLQVGDAVYTLSQGNSQSNLVAVTAQGQVQTYGLGSTATSLDVNPSGEVLMIATGCPTGTNCAEKPNRLYAFQIAAKQFQSNAQFEYLPLQTSPARIRFDSVGENIYFDGVVSGSNGVGQRFVFSLELNSTQLLSARVAIPSSSWLPVGIDANNLNLGSQTPAVNVPSDVPKGGGIGSGGIGAAPVPLDEIERLLGMSIWEIDWSKITDEQIRAFGYDPAEVRRYVAQLRLQAGSAATIGNSDTITCRLGSAEGADQIAAIESVLGVSLLQFDFSQVTDEQIRAFGYDPAEVRQLIGQYKQNAEALAKNGGDPCANTYTQDAFVVNQGSDKAAVANGTVTQVTAQTRFDLLNGGWLVNLRWQAPGGAQKFHIYGRDDDTHKLERQLAVVDGLQRSVKFGGFNRIALPAIHSAEYTLAVVPEQADGSLGAPTAIKTQVRCFVVWCHATAVAK